MKFLFSFLFTMQLMLSADSQENIALAIDSIKSSLAEAAGLKEKLFWLDNLSRTLMNVNLEEADKYGEQMIRLAEESRDREAMVEAYMSNGLRCSYFAGQKDYVSRSQGFYNKALEIADQNKMEEQEGAIQLRLSSLMLSIPDKDKALSYVNQAFSLISTLPDDSLMAEAHNVYGQIYQARNEKTLALRHFLNALRISEGMKNHTLQRNCYIFLSNFYKDIGDIDKALDYLMLAHKKLDKMNEKNIPYQRAIDFNTIGNLFAAKDNQDLAISYFERSIAMADSLNFSNLKIPGYISLLNQYLRLNQPGKALDYMNSAAGQSLKKFLVDFGFESQVFQAYGFIYENLNKLDSAEYYFLKALPYYENFSNLNLKASFFSQLASLYKNKNENNLAIDYYMLVKNTGEQTGSLEMIRSAAKNLDTLYERTGNFKLAREYNSIYFQFKDSIEKIKKDNEIAQIAAQDEQQRQERMIQEKEELKRKRNQIQYMAITIGIAIMFIILVMMGWFKVSAVTIKAIGFFAFLIFFEFIFLVFKKNIYGITEGEPWKDLSFMIALAALLVPLHHWLEHRVIRFLTSHRMLKLKGMLTGRQEEETT